MGRPQHLLTATENQEKPTLAIYFDSESIIEKPSEIHRPYLICACFTHYRTDCRATNNWKDYYGEELRYSFWSDVAKCAKPKKVVYMYAHNAGYDVLVTQGILQLSLYHGFTVESFFEKGSVYLMTFTNKKRKIVVVSTTNYYAATLRKLGKIVGLEKMEIEYQEATYETALPYCRRDVEIIKKAMEDFFHFVELEHLGCLGKTISSQSFNAFRHRFMQHEIFIHNREKAIKLERAAYYGGRVECWQIGKLPQDEKYYKVDVNSMYPYVMRNFPMPVKLKSYTKYNSIEDIRYFLKEGKGIIAKVLIKTDKPCYPYRMANKLIFPVGQFITYLAAPELEIALKYKHIIRVYEISTYDLEPIFGEFVDYFYTKRQEAKASGNEIHNYMYKLIMNSLYGKFGQLSESWKRTGDAEPEIVKAEHIVDGDTGEITYRKTFGGSVFEQEGTGEAFNSFPAVAAYVTSYARVTLLNFIIVAGWENVLYMDTDSLFLREQGYNNILASGAIDDKKLGALKLEEISNIVEIYAPKDYTFGETTKKKGINSNAEKISETEFMTWNWPKLSTFIREGNLKEFRNIWRTKILTRAYEKGTIQTDGRVIPYKLSER